MTAVPTWRRPPVVAMAAGALVLAAAGGVLLATASGDSAGGSGGNSAVVDAAATSRVVGQVDTALTRVLSYRYSNPAATQAAAKQVLVGDAAHQYDVLFAALQKRASGEKLTLAAKVVSAGVTSLVGDHAELLVFLDQTSTRASDGTTSASAAQLRIAAVRRGGSWRISELVPL